MQFTENEQSHYKGPFAEKAKFKSAEEEYEYRKVTNKSCNKCKKELPLTSFGFNTSGKDPFDKNGYRLHRGDCVECNKEISKGKSEAKKVAKQNGISFKAPAETSCEICGSKDKIVFDHDHKRNVFRGWLCNGCNRSIGMLGENIESLLKTFNYMNKMEKKKLEWDDGKGEYNFVEESLSINNSNVLEEEEDDKEIEELTKELEKLFSTP